MHVVGFAFKELDFVRAARGGQGVGASKPIAIRYDECS
jgi:hypothetical protein